MRSPARSIHGLNRTQNCCRRQWKAFFDEGGGVLPLLECISDGARSVEEAGKDDGQRRDGGRGAFGEACTACRALRDLSSISKDFAAVVTDEVLETDGRWSTCVVEGDGFDCSNGGILSDLLVLLTHATAEEGRLYGRKEDGRRRGEGIMLDMVREDRSHSLSLFPNAKTHLRRRPAEVRPVHRPAHARHGERE